MAGPTTTLMDQIVQRIDALPAWLQAAVLLGGPVLVLLAVHGVLTRVLRRVTRRDGAATPASKLVNRTTRPGAVLLVVLGLGIGMSVLAERGGAPLWSVGWWGQAFSVVVTLAFTWLIVAAVSGVDDMILARYRMDVKDNLRARRMHTQIRVLSRTLMVIVAIAGVAIALMQFDAVEQIGTSLLASAGIAGIAVGFAARPVLGNLIAGIQIAITQPIRLDDAVVIEGEWGWIEEITATYVVVRIWDQRRLIVPFSKIIEEPFQNWTRKTSEILGDVVLHVDYACPVDAVRAELDRILDGHPKWDGRAKVLQVIEATPKTMVLRALVTAVDSPTAWELRCDVRERLLGFMQREMPYALPREREVEYHEDQWPRRAAPKDVPTAERELDDPTLRGEGAAPPPDASDAVRDARDEIGG